MAINEFPIITRVLDVTAVLAAPGQAAASAAAAEAALDGTIAAAASIGMYADTTLAAALVTGLAAATEGQTFHATGADVDYVGVYKDLSGVAVEQARYPKAEAVEAIIAILEDGGDLSQAIDTGLVDSDETVETAIGSDAAGYSAAVVLADGTVAIQKARAVSLEVRDQLDLAGPLGSAASLKADVANYDFAVTDDDDNVIFGVLGNELQLPGYVNGPGLTSDDLSDVYNIAHSLAIAQRPLQGVQQPVADFNSVVLAGQSLAMAQEAWPARSRSQAFGNLMLGGDVRPTSLDGAGWTQIGTPGLQPLVGVVRANSGGAILSDAAVAALSPGDGARGEVPGIGMVNMASWLIGRKTLGAPKPFILLCPAVSGMTIEQLSKVNTQDGTDRYSRYTAGLTQAHSAATTGANADKTHALAAIVWMQGEWDYSTTYGSTKATKAAYKAALQTLRNDMVADAKTITGQTEDPIFILYQTGASYTIDADSTGAAGLHVGMAQLEFALENPGKVILAGPHYQVTDKGGHLNVNGSRWYGQLLAKAFHRGVVEGRQFRPLSPTRIEQISPTVLRVHFHVPAPPLAFDTPYVVTTATDYATKGFRVTDTDGSVTINAVDLVGSTIVDLTCARAVDADTGHVWYASKTTHNGNGNLRDSDTTLSRDLYEYIAGDGEYTAANIAALVNKPYPLHNWCCAFYLPIGYEE